MFIPGGFFVALCHFKLILFILGGGQLAMNFNWMYNTPKTPVIPMRVGDGLFTSCSRSKLQAGTPPVPKNKKFRSIVQATMLDCLSSCSFKLKKTSKKVHTEL